MQIDGKSIADGILIALSEKISALKTRGVTPTLAVVLIGDNPASLAYIKQKQKAAERIGAKIAFCHQSSAIRQENLQKIIAQYNNDPNIHGIIIQRPLPNTLIAPTVTSNKDIDGFETNSPFDVPVALAVDKILQNAKCQMLHAKFVVIGRGETAGAPIAAYFKKHQYDVTVIHSQTSNPQKFIKTADVIISCVGKERIITKEQLKPGVILVSVGIWRNAEGKLQGDYDEADIADRASWYTPTPGGVGPVNVACLMQNLVQACTINKGGI